MANQDPNQDRQDPKQEIPGDTNSADIVDRTGEQMPRQSHDGVDSDDRDVETGSDDDDAGENNPRPKGVPAR